jgi:hypothetical protein
MPTRCRSLPTPGGEFTRSSGNSEGREPDLCLPRRLRTQCRVAPAALLPLPGARSPLVPTSGDAPTREPSGRPIGRPRCSKPPSAPCSRSLPRSR